MSYAKENIRLTVFFGMKLGLKLSICNIVPYHRMSNACPNLTI
jgi:hypothetical protein